MVTPESTGIDIAWTIIKALFDTLVADVGRVIIDDIVGGFFEVFVGFIFGGGLSTELAFCLVFSLALFGIFWKYIYNVGGG